MTSDPISPVTISTVDPEGRAGILQSLGHGCDRVRFEYGVAVEIVAYWHRQAPSFAGGSKVAIPIAAIPSKASDGTIQKLGLHAVNNFCQLTARRVPAGGAHAAGCCTAPN